MPALRTGRAIARIPENQVAAFAAIPQFNNQDSRTYLPS
jgi:hypothetical protein